MWLALRGDAPATPSHPQPPPSPFALACSRCGWRVCCPAESALGEYGQLIMLACESGRGLRNDNDNNSRIVYKSFLFNDLFKSNLRKGLQVRLHVKFICVHELNLHHFVLLLLQM